MFRNEIFDFIELLMENISEGNMEVYRWYDPDSEGAGVRQKGSWGDVDNSFIFMSYDASWLYWGNTICEWLEINSYEEFLDVEKKDLGYIKDEIFDTLIYEFKDLEERFELLDMVWTGKTTSLLDLSNDLQRIGFGDIYDNDLEEILRYENVAIGNKYILEFKVIDRNEDINKTTLEITNVENL